MWSCRARAKDCGLDNRPLEVLGKISANLVYRDMSCDHPIYILGLPAIRFKQLNSLAQVDTIVNSVPDQHPDVSTALGNFPETYQVKLKPDAEPFALFTPRNVTRPPFEPLCYLEDGATEDGDRAEKVFGYGKPAGELNIPKISQLLRELPSSCKTRLWGPAENKAFDKLKHELT